MKTKSRLYVLIVLVLVAALSFFVSCKKVDDNILKNGNFEDSETTIESAKDWNIITNDKQGKVIFLKQDPNVDGYKAQLGNNYVKFNTSSKLAEVYISQEIALKRGVTYEISVDIYVPSDIESDASKKDTFKGAYVGFINYPDFEGINIKKKTNGWERKTIYFRNDTDAKTITLRIGLGSKIHGLAKGTFEVDNIVVKKVKNLPSGAVLQTMGGNKISYLDTPGSKTFVAMMTLLSIALVTCGAIFVARHTSKNNKGLMLDKSESISYSKIGKAKKVLLSTPAKIAYFIIIAFLIRFLIISFVGAFDVLSKQTKVAFDLAKYNPTGIYNENVERVPFGLMYLYWFIGLYGNALKMSSSSQSMMILIRLPNLIADLITCFVIYMMLSECKNKKIGFIGAMAYATLPIFFISGTILGFFSPILVLFLLGMFYAIIKKQNVVAIVMFFLAWSFDYYALVVFPILLCYLIYQFIKIPESRFSIALTLVTAIVVHFLFALPFDIAYVSKGEIFHVYTVQGEAFKLDKLFAKDTINLYSIFGLGNSTSTTVMVVLCFISLLCLYSYVIYAYFMKSNRLDTMLFASFIFVALGSLGTKASLSLYAVGLFLLLIYALVVNDIRLYGIFGALTTFVTVNMTKLISQSGYISNNPNKQYMSFMYNDPLLIFFSILAVAVTVYFAYVVIDIIQNSAVIELNKDTLVLKNTREYTKSAINDIQEKRVGKKEEKAMKLAQKNNTEPKQAKENYGIKKEKNNKKNKK